MSAAPPLTSFPRVSGEELDDRDMFEIVDGQRVEIAPMSADSQFIASRLAYFLSAYAMPRGIGEACTEVLFKLPLPVDRNRRPDVAFVPYSRWRKNSPIPATNAWEILPDICVEVVSPTDNADELSEKITEYFAAGVRQVWVLYPRQELVYIYNSPTEVHGLTRADKLEGGYVLPGFELLLSELLPEPEPTSTTDSN